MLQSTMYLNEFLERLQSPISFSENTKKIPQNLWQKDLKNLPKNLVKKFGQKNLVENLAKKNWSKIWPKNLAKKFGQ